ncbi:hypothetical protein CLOM_g5367 [Closterium sp. NIES-68]|nr:hypothetical protein CLOM_g5367 [Closterium sp. NIES-68]GJP81910.1 hypothetical protein CLOP_g12042 [Closterium sp. NIES-67]
MSCCPGRGQKTRAVGVEARDSGGGWGRVGEGGGGWGRKEGRRRAVVGVGRWGEVVVKNVCMGHAGAHCGHVWGPIPFLARRPHMAQDPGLVAAAGSWVALPLPQYFHLSYMGCGVHGGARQVDAA